MSQTIIEDATIVVDAVDIKQASEIARQMAADGKVDFTFWDSLGDIEVDDVMPAEGVTA